MTDNADLERRNRRLLAFYPKAFRREHEQEQEILSVLMAGAAVGQQRPRLAESADLLRNAIFIRLRQMKPQPSWEYSHPLPWIGCAFLALPGCSCSPPSCAPTPSGGGWAVAPAALHFYLAYRLMHIIPRDRW